MAGPVKPFQVEMTSLTAKWQKMGLGRQSGLEEEKP